MQICQKMDVDGVTIIINSQNKLEAILPEELPNQNLEFEEVEPTDYVAKGGYDVYKETYLQSFGIENKEVKVVKLVRVKGTDYFMFKLEGVRNAEQPPEEPPVDEPTSPADTPPKDTSNAKEYFPEGEAPKVVIDTTNYNYEISGSMKLKADDGTYLTDMTYLDTTDRVSNITFRRYPHTNAFIYIDGEFSGPIGQKRYSLVSTSEGIRIQDELGVQTQSVSFNMKAPDQYGNETNHSVTVEVTDDEIIVYGQGMTVRFGDPRDSYPAFFKDLFGYSSSDFNYVEV